MNFFNVKNDLQAIGAVILLGLSLLTALLLEFDMASGSDLQMVVIFIGIIVCGYIFYDFWKTRMYSHIMSLFVFCAALLNLIWLVSATSAVFLSVLSLLINLGGLVLCIISLQESESSSLGRPSVETYDLEPLRKLVRETSRRAHSVKF